MIGLCVSAAKSQHPHSIHLRAYFSHLRGCLQCRDNACGTDLWLDCKGCPDTALVVQGHTEEELVRQLRQQLVQDADKLRGSALCDVLWSLGILDDLPVATYTQLASLLEQQPLRDFQPSVRLHSPDAINSIVGIAVMPACMEKTLRSMLDIRNQKMPQTAGTMSPPNLRVVHKRDILSSLPKSEHLSSLHLGARKPHYLVRMQDFRRLYEVQRIVQACLPAEERGQVVLPGWMRAYASAAWQDRYFAEQNFTPLQQVSQHPRNASGAPAPCMQLPGLGCSLCHCNVV